LFSLEIDSTFGCYAFVLICLSDCDNCLTLQSHIFGLDPALFVYYSMALTLQHQTHYVSIDYFERHAMGLIGNDSDFGYSV